MFGSTFHASVAQSAAAAAERMRASSPFQPADGARAFPDASDATLASGESSEAHDQEKDDDVYELADAYGSDAAARLAKILRHLERVGFAKARANEWSAFDRILSGVAWILQQIVKREDTVAGRVQWDALFQSHTKMKPRLGFAQEVVKRVEALPYTCPVQIQPHQLLLQDFGDIGAVHRLVTWLIDQQQSATPHLDAIRKDRKYQDVLDPSRLLNEPKPLKKDVLYLQNAFKPRRKWQYMASEDWKNEPEDALIQRCLLEYGERVCVAVLDDGISKTASVEVNGKPPNLMAQLASQAAAAATAGATLTKTRPGSGGRRGGRASSSKRFVDPQAADFEIQYQKAMKQAIAEQQELLNRQKEREIQLLQQVVSVPESDESELLGGLAAGIAVAAGSVRPLKARSSVQLEKERVALQEHEVQVQQLIEAKRVLEAQTQEAQEQATAVTQAIASIEQEIAQLDVKEAQDRSAQPFLATLKKLVIQNETLKRQKTEFRVKCRTELENLHARIAQLKLQAEEDLANQDEETLRLNEIEQMHAQMATKHKEMKVALAKQTREIQLKMRQIDEVPTRIELIQYEKRFLELYEEVALTLDETRKYYCTYNTLQTTQEFLEREISLINSIHENFDVAMSSKAATQAFFTQLEGIIQNVQGTVTKQQAQRADHQTNVETLDSKYQLLLEKERTYVNAIREFQKECEKNEKLAARLAQVQAQGHQPQTDQQP
ncbi:hypothetical protein Gpo141_00013318 [Globisporangium polare]